MAVRPRTPARHLTALAATAALLVACSPPVEKTADPTADGRTEASAAVAPATDPTEPEATDPPEPPSDGHLVATATVEDDRGP